MGADLVLGLDLGGSSCRAVLADTGGLRVGEGHAGGANPCGHPLADATAALADAIAGALRAADPHRVRAVVAGMAGHAALADPATRAAVTAVFERAGLRCPVRLRPDCEIAFAAGSAAPDGALLLAGTGSMAAALRGREIAQRRGGHGWLLGDEGSAFWLGREGVRHALAAMQDGRHGALADAVLDAVLAGAPRTADTVVSAVHLAPPVTLARYAPLVCAAADAGDPAAVALVERAADLLTTAVLPLCEAGSPVVLAGALLTRSPVGDRVRLRLADAGVDGVRVAGDTAAAAAWLAALDAGACEGAGDTGHRARFALHARLLSPRSADGAVPGDPQATPAPAPVRSPRHTPRRAAS